MLGKNVKKVLLIDDEYVSNLIMKKYLEGLGYTNFIVKNNGQQALDYLNKNPTPTPSYIFLDLRMPIMDGFEFLEELKNSEILNHKMKVFILTSSINPNDIETAKKYKFINGFIQKPINPAHLQDILEAQ